MFLKPEISAMLIDTMFEMKSLQVAENTIEATLGILPDNAIYKAHFIGRPITPGVCIMQIVQEVLEKAIGSRLLLEKAKNVKFLSLLTPDETQQVCLTINYDPATLTANAVMKDNETVIAKMTLTYRRDS